MSDGKHPRNGLTKRQELFVANYNGNGVESARLSGYEGDENTLAVQASRLLRMDKIITAIKARESKEVRKGIKSRQDLQEMWCRICDDESVSMSDRLAASALMARSEAMFTERVEVNTDDLAERIRRGRERAK